MFNTLGFFGFTMVVHSTMDGERKNHRPIVYMSVAMEKPTKQQHIPSCEGGEISAKMKSESCQGTCCWG